LIVARAKGIEAAFPKGALLGESQVTGLNAPYPHPSELFSSSDFALTCDFSLTYVTEY
jgi:hypothetical protein